MPRAASQWCGAAATTNGGRRTGAPADPGEVRGSGAGRSSAPGARRLEKQLAADREQLRENESPSYAGLGRAGPAAHGGGGGRGPRHRAARDGDGSASRRRATPNSAGGPPARPRMMRLVQLKGSTSTAAVVAHGRCRAGAQPGPERAAGLVSLGPAAGRPSCAWPAGRRPTSPHRGQARGRAGPAAADHPRCREARRTRRREGEAPAGTTPAPRRRPTGWSG